MPHFDIRNRDMDKKISFKYLWMKDQIQKIRLRYSKDVLSDKEIQEYLTKVYDDRYQPEGRFMSNITKENKVMKLEQFINRFINSDYILSGYACLFESHKSDNIGAKALKYLLDQRKVYKKKMNESEKGSDDYIYYKILQLTYKILANSYYGITGLASSPFFNPFLQNSTTFTGQDIITTSIEAMESFLGDNVPFNDLSDAVEYINNIVSVNYKNTISQYLDKNVDINELVDYFEYKTDKKSKTFRETLYSIFSNIKNKYGDEMLNRIYYKNQIMKLLLKNTYFKNDLSNRLNKKYENDSEFASLICDFSFYDFILEDRFKRAKKQTRKSVIVVDTDSNFLYFDNQIQEIITELNLEHSSESELNVMNMFIDISTEALRRIFWVLTTNLGVEDAYKPIINMKNEFVYSKLLTTKNKKHYAGLLLAELGKPINKPAEERLDIKGLPIRKSVVPKTLRELFTKYLLEEILLPEKIRMSDVLREYNDIVNSVKRSLTNGEATYLIPSKIGVLTEYKFPERMPQVRGTILWNALEPEKTIVPPENVNLIKLKTGYALNKNKNESDEEYNKRLFAFLDEKPEFKWLKENYPEKYEIILKTVYKKNNPNPSIDFSDKGAAIIAIPKDAEIPEYLKPLINLEEMIESNTAAGTTMLGALGIYCVKGKRKSNIIRL